MTAPSFGFVNKNSFRSFFSQKSFSKVLILLFSTKKMTFKVLTLERDRNIVRGLFRRFGHWLTSISSESGEFRQNTINIIGDTYTPYFWSFRWWSLFYFSLSRSIPLLHPKYDQKSFVSQNWLKSSRIRKKQKQTLKGSATKFEQNCPYIRDFHPKKSISFLTTPSENGLNNSTLSICWDTEKMIKNTSDMCKYLWHTSGLRNVKVWTKFFRLVLFGTLYETISILWFIRELDKNEKISSKFSILKIWWFLYKIAQLVMK